MQVIADSLRLSPTDLSSFLGCRHRTGLDLSVAQGTLEKPDWTNLVSAALRDRGEAHERNYVDSLKAQGLGVLDLNGSDEPIIATLEALRKGTDVVVQGALEAPGWLGRSPRHRGKRRR